ncbi:MAG: hypothetical protein IH851_13200 [Armatimonadetes bacterium]|nr:hypothetical protein [Armatimonadota bacterium]
MKIRTALSYFSAVLIGLCAVGPASSQGTGSWGPLLDPDDGAWPSDLEAINMIHMQGGKILMWGLLSVDPSGTQSYVFDAYNGTFMNEPFANPWFFDELHLFCSGHSILDDGKVLIAGGEVLTHGAYGIINAETFDPVALSWVPVCPWAPWAGRAGIQAS